MCEEGQVAGMSPEQVWSYHWQPLMCDLAVCMAACTPGGQVEALLQQPQVISNTVVSNLIAAFSTPLTAGWQQLLQGMRTAMHEHTPQPAGSQAEAKAAVVASAIINTLASGPRQAAGVGLGETNGQGQAAASATIYPAGHTGIKSPSPPSQVPSFNDPSTASTSIASRALTIKSSLQLLVSGFPDAQQEREWQEARGAHFALSGPDQLGVVLQVAIMAGIVGNMLQAGLLTSWRDADRLLLATCHPLGWACALMW
jgi:hypothetical protein